MRQPRGRDAATKRALVTQVSAAAAVATGTAAEAFRAWIVEVSPDEVSVGGTVLGDWRGERRVGQLDEHGRRT